MSSNTTNMKSVATYLAVGLSVVVALLWFSPWDTGSEKAGGGGGGTAVKVDDKLASQGEEISTANGCTSCHSIDGAPGAGPTWQGLYGSTGKRGGTVDEVYVVETMAKPPAAMASFQGKIDEEQAKAIAEYIKSLH